MKFNGEIQKLVQRKCHNEQDYYHQVVWPFLDILGIPQENSVRYPQFSIRTFLGEQRTDFLILVNDIPILAVEGKNLAKKFEEGKEQVKFFSTNFDPSPKGVRKQTVPFQLVLAGNKAQLFKIVINPDGITPELKALDGFFEWGDLLREAGNFKSIVPIVERGQIAFPIVKEVTAPEVLASTQASQFLQDLFNSITLYQQFKNPDEPVLCLNDILQVLFSNGDLTKTFAKYNLPARIQKKVNSVIPWYNFKTLPRPTIAYAYREFVSDSFDGVSYMIQQNGSKKRKPQAKDVGRYITPIEVIKFMVELVGIDAEDKVIDFACGSAGFLGEAIGRVKKKTNGNYQDFIRKNLFACDIDPFAVSTSKTFLSLLYPELKEEFNIFQHNGLYSETLKKPQMPEEKGLERSIKAGIFDLVISNPPGNKEYSGTNANFVRKKFKIESFFWDVVPFMKRAFELTKSEGGRICLLVPDGFCTNEQLQFIRDEAMKNCQVNAIISLPRIFKNNNAQMSIIYLKKTRKKDKKRNTLLASIPLKVPKEGEEEAVNINSELANILTTYKEFEKEEG
jgi:type I restriction-modification system DNA methylase subunit